MKTIFVVTSGQYSDYRVNGIFTDEEKAKKFVDMFDKSEWEKMSVEQWELNPAIKNINKGYKYYFIRMRKNGDTSEINLDNYYDFNDTMRTGFDVNNNMFTYAWAKDEKHAIKIANERRIQLIASNEWK